MKLIVIGNGFDLHCGLNSRFSDFFDKKMKDENGKYIVNVIRTNVWYLLFYFRFISGIKDGVCDLIHKDNILWMDVESFISSTLNEKTGFAHGHPMITINNVFYTKVEYPKNIDDFHYILSDSFSNQQSEIAALMSKKDKGLNPYDFLLNELKNFEIDFSNYLTEELNNNESYLKIFESTLKDIAEDEMSFLINFNYTFPSSLDFCLSVHGNLRDKNIIIGTDASTIADGNPRVFRFTKAWRKLSNKTKNTRIPDKSEVTEIVFYGHSLSQQDYAYFHSLFTFYDIYNSGVVLTFLYSDYEFKDMEKKYPDKEKNERNKDAYVDKVFALLRSYVEKTMNSAEANVVITKIQLENRLRIHELNEYLV